MIIYCFVKTARMSNIETSHQQTFTYTAQATTTVVTEVETPPARWHFPRIKTGFDHTYLRSIEGILRIISVVSEMHDKVVAGAI